MARCGLHISYFVISNLYGLQISGRGKELKPLEIAIAGASLVALDKGTALALNRWQALPAVIRRLPSSTVCLLLVVAGLLAVDRADPNLAKKVTGIFEPAVEILQRWMPLFYTPAVVMMSLFAQTMSVEEGVRLTTLLSKIYILSQPYSCILDLKLVYDG